MRHYIIFRLIIQCKKNKTRASYLSLDKSVLFNLIIIVHFLCHTHQKVTNRFSLSNCPFKDIEKNFTSCNVYDTILIVTESQTRASLVKKPFNRVES